MLAPGYAFDVTAGGYVGMSFSVATYPGLKALAAAGIAVGVLSVALDLLAIETGLSFLGLVVFFFNDRVGGLIYTGLSYVSVAWWLLVFPLSALLASVALLRHALLRLSGGAR